jgi:tetraacyldisaccharide 4'-kinase
MVVGPSSSATEAVESQARSAELPIVRARVVPDEDTVKGLRGRPVLAFAGIGDPGKLFAMLASDGIAVKSARSFPDHHHYTTAEAEALLAEADRDGLTLVTTEKDMARMRGGAAVAALARRARAVAVTLVFDDPPALLALLRRPIERG